MPEHRRIQKVLSVRGSGIVPDKVLGQRDRNRRTFSDNHSRNLKGFRYGILSLVHEGVEETVKQAVRGGEHFARQEEGERAGFANQLGEVERGAGVGNDAAAGKDEADFGVFVGDTNVHRERDDCAGADRRAVNLSIE